MRLVLFLGLFICYTFAEAQVIDSFSDGNFSSSPSWVGNTGNWQIVQDSDVAGGANNSNTLRLNVDSGSGISYLSVQYSGEWGSSQSWSFWLGRRAQAVTTSNYSCVWLWASESNLNSGTVDGYRIKFGDSSGDDEFQFQRVDDGSANTIFTSNGAVPNGLEDFGVLVRVVRNPVSEWSIYTSTIPLENGEGAISKMVPSKIHTPIFQGKGVEEMYKSFSYGYIGVSTKYSTSADARSGAEFDQFYFMPNSDASLPVALSMFNAEYTSDQVKITWTTQSEFNNLGFVVLRANQEEGPFSPISELIPGRGTNTNRQNYEFYDAHVKSNETYYYKLEQRNFDGSVKLYGPIELKVEDSAQSALPNETYLVRNYPNPFNPGTVILLHTFEENGIEARISIHNIQGRKIRHLVETFLSCGVHRFQWDGFDDLGNPVPAGIYFCYLETASGELSTIKLLKI